MTLAQDQQKSGETLLQPWTSQAHADDDDREKSVNG